MANLRAAAISSRRPPLLASKSNAPRLYSKPYCPAIRLSRFARSLNQWKAKNGFPLPRHTFQFSLSSFNLHDLILVCNAIDRMTWFRFLPTLPPNFDLRLLDRADSEESFRRDNRVSISGELPLVARRRSKLCCRAENSLPSQHGQRGADRYISVVLETVGGVCETVFLHTRYRLFEAKKEPNQSRWSINILTR